MKIIRNILTTAFTLMLVVSCTEKSEEDIFKIYPIKDPQNVRLSDHTENSLTISWDEIEEAIFYQVQLFDADDSESPIADFRINDESSYTFSELNKDGLYNARVRVFVEKTKSSEWVYMMTDDGRWATLNPIIGMVDNIKVVENALKLLNSTSSTLTVSWTFNQQSELSNKYTIEIFRDKACTDLELSWNDIGGTDLFPEYLRYTFSGLESNKSYFIKVTDLTNNLLSGVKEFKTQHPLPAVGGDVLLTQDFANFIHGGDITYVAAGYSVTASGRTAYNKATGNNPVDPAIGMNPAKWTAEFNVFDGGGVTPAYTRSVGMEGWGKDGNTSTRAGYIKIGGNKGIARLYTPELSSLEGNSTVKVTFKSAMYKESGTSYSSEILVQAVDNAVFDDQGRITNLDAIDIKDDKLISIENADGFFAEYEVTLENVTPNTRIVFGSNPDRQSENRTRFLLDEIVISKL